MLCYKDMTFCTNWRRCANGDQCHRALTEEVKRGAVASGLDIATQRFNDCFMDKCLDLPRHDNRGFNH